MEKFNFELAEDEQIKKSLHYSLIDAAMKELTTGIIDRLEQAIVVRLERKGFKIYDLKEFAKDRLTVIEKNSIKELYIDYETPDEIFICMWFFEGLDNPVKENSNGCSITATFKMTE